MAFLIASGTCLALAWATPILPAWFPTTTNAEKLAKKAVEKKITKIYFDRGVYKYHGRVKAFAETLRKNGMEF